MYGPEITREMIPIIRWEGFSYATYRDSKGVETTGVGQTGDYSSLSYPEVFRIKKAELLRYTPNLASLPEAVQDALLVANYRGDWAGSPKTRAFFTEGMYDESAEEYLNNAEYRDPATPEQIKRRFEWVAEAIRSMGTKKANPWQPW
jgi:GH24 family phage-related lysozyme (muramidase)